MALSETLKPLGDKVAKLRDKGKEWDEIGEQLDVRPGKAMLAYEFAIVSPSEKVKAKTDDAMAKAIVRLRDNEALSWGKISARTDLPESRCRKMYEEATSSSTLGNRIGKGGRYPGGSNGGARKPAKKKAAKKKGTAKKAPAKKKATAKKAAKKKGVKKSSPKVGKPTANKSGGRVPIIEMNEDQITERLNGKTIGVEIDGKTRRFKVDTVDSLSAPGGDLTFTDVDGEEHTVPVEDITTASK